MKTAFSITFTIICLTITPVFASPLKPVIKGPEVRIINNEIIVSTAIDNVARLRAIIDSGIEKEIVYRIELIRAWKFWPDEFVVSRKVRRYIGYDTLRDKYYVSWKKEGNYTMRYFDDFESMKPLIFTVRGIDLMNIKALESGTYYVRVIVESKSRQRIRLMGILMYLMPEVEMSLIKESPPFKIER
jgi:hypothetical protein